MPAKSSPRVAAARHATALLEELPADAGPLRVVVATGGLACLVVVWPAAGAMPTARRGCGRASCRAEVLAAVRAAGGAVTRKAVGRLLRAAGSKHGVSTVTKALADLTAAGELLNPRDKLGYRLPGWVPRHRQPSLFD